MTHPEDDMILRYISGGAGGEEETAIDAHLADCSACTGRVRALAYLRDNFASLWQTWTAAEHGRACQQWRLAAALGQVAGTVPALAAKARQWLRRLGEAVGLAVDVLVDRERRAALTAPRALPAGCLFRLQPAMVGVGSAEELVEAEEHLRRGAELLSQGREDEAAAEALRAAQIDARSPQTATSEVSHQSRRVFEIVANSRRGTVSAKYWPLEGEPAPAFALLLAAEAEAPPQAAEFKPVEGASYLLAEFEGVPTGPYTLEAALLPPEQKT